MAKPKNTKSVQAIMKEKSERMMEGVAYWAAFYRKNPQRFAKEFMNIDLKLFQKILLFVWMASTNIVFIAVRGIGKTWLTTLYMVIRCILFPETKIISAFKFSFINSFK